jgi:hypothetical protein
MILRRHRDLADTPAYRPAAVADRGAEHFGQGYDGHASTDQLRKIRGRRVIAP